MRRIQHLGLTCALFLLLFAPATAFSFGSAQAKSEQDQIDSSTGAVVESGSPITPEPMKAKSEYKLSLREAIQIGLESSDVLRKLTGGEISVDAATWYEPQTAQERAREALAEFDVAFESEVGYRWLRSPPESFFGPGLQQAERRDVGVYNAGFVKRWQTGTVTRTGYRPDPSYLFFPDGTAGFNPNHVSAVEFSIRQALLQGRSNAVNGAPIRIAQLNGERSSWEFKQALIEFVRSVEQAYWEFQAATAAREVIEQQVPAFDEVVRLEEAAMKAERSAIGEVAKARTRRHEFRRLLIEAIAEERERERTLRALIGLSLEDTAALVPTTLPSEAPTIIDLPAATAVAMNEQPRLVRRRLILEIREAEMAVAQDSFRPRLDVSALYRANGLAEQLGDSLDQMITNDFHDWEVGATLNVPLQRNGATARIHAAELQLQRERAVLREEARVVAYDLTNAVNDIQSLHEQFQESKERVAQGKQWLEVARIRHKTPPPNRDANDNRLLVALDDYLDALREVADASEDAASILARYNTALARLEEIQGTLLESRDLFLFEDPCHQAQVQETLLQSDPIPLAAAAQEAMTASASVPAPSVEPSAEPRTTLAVSPHDSFRRYPLPAQNSPWQKLVAPPGPSGISIIQPPMSADSAQASLPAAPPAVIPSIPVSGPGLTRYPISPPSEIPQSVPGIRRLPMSTLGPPTKK